MSKSNKLPVIQDKCFAHINRSPKGFKSIKQNTLKLIKIDTLLITKTSDFSSIQSPNDNKISVVKPKKKHMTYAYLQEFKPKTVFICEKIKKLNIKFKNVSKEYQRKVKLDYSVEYSKENNLPEMHKIDADTYRKNIHEIYDRLRELNLNNTDSI